jgi:hypothetical protein
MGNIPLIMAGRYRTSDVRMEAMLAGGDHNRGHGASTRAPPELPQKGFTSQPEG